MAKISKIFEFPDPGVKKSGQDSGFAKSPVRIRVRIKPEKSGTGKNPVCQKNQDSGPDPEKSGHGS
jgi:hypothetical protein